MSVSLKNPNPYSLVVKADARHTKGFLSCDRDPREILEIAANGVVQLQCTASWQAAIDRLGRPRSAAQMDVYERSHTFRCIRGCTLKDNWNCPTNGTCSTTITVTMDRWEHKPD